METQFILDTNAYRQIVANKYLCEIMATANEMRIREKIFNAKSLMSIIVSMELLKHFNESDPNFHTCFKGLALQYFHTQSKSFGEPDNNINFIPPINPLITQHFFKKNSEYLKYYYRILEIIENATKNLEPNDFKKDEKDIRLCKDQLLHERTEIRDNFEEFIKYVNEGVVDWEFFKKDKKIKPKLFGEIKSGKMIQLLAMALLKRAHAILDLEFLQPGLETQFKYFCHYYEPILRINQSLFEKMLHGATTLADPGHPRWNTHNDMQLLAAACFTSYRERDKEVRVIVVTDDKAIHDACKGTYLEGQTWKLREYLSYIY